LGDSSFWNAIFCPNYDIAARNYDIYFSLISWIYINFGENPSRPNAERPRLSRRGGACHSVVETA
jgi:hypothetical protein